jgi:hypothetical protein
VDPKTEEFTFQTAPSKALFATKNFTIPPFTTVLAQARTFQDVDPQLHYIADIGAPKQPWISGLSTLVSFDQRKQCTMPIQNCAPHEVTVSTGDMLGILSTEKEDPIPFDDESLATICEQIHQRLPKIKKRAWTRKEIEEKCHLGAPEPYRSKYIDILVKHQAAISLDKYHHFQTFTIGDLSVCKGPCSSRQTNSAQAKTTVNAFANPDSIRLSRVPEMQPDLHYRSLHRKPIVPTYLLSGQVRKSENDRYNDSSHIQLPRFL